MKKLLMIAAVFTMVAGLFAYEPKKECVTVKGNKVRYEETYTKYWTFTDTRMWTYKVKSGKFIYLKSGTFDSMWDRLCRCREVYDTNLKVASFKDEKCSTCATIEKFKKAYENGELNSDEIAAYKALVALHGSANDVKGAIEGNATHAKTGTKSYYEVAANDEKVRAINEIPFVTEENWYTITREELLNKICAFVSECTK